MGKWRDRPTERKQNKVKNKYAKDERGGQTYSQTKANKGKLAARDKQIIRETDEQMDNPK